MKVSALVWMSCLCGLSFLAAQPPLPPLPPQPEAPPFTVPPPRPLPGVGAPTTPPTAPPSASVTGVAADPPGAAELRQALEQLRGERDALARQRAETSKTLEPDSVFSSERIRLQMKILELLGKLEQRGKLGIPPPPVDPPVKPQPPEPDRGPPQPPRSIDPGLAADRLTLAQTLYQANDIDGALRELDRIDQATLSKKDRAWVQYLKAGCFRKQNKLNEAAVLYREVADARADDFLTESALWHVSFLRWQQEIQAQLEDARRRRGVPGVPTP